MEGIRTDLAVEQPEVNQEAIRGVTLDSDQVEGIDKTEIRITAEAEERMNRKPGTYVTLESEAIRKQDTAMQRKLTTVTASVLRQLLVEEGIGEDARGLLIGLGNHMVTPDALGPFVMEEVLVTSHLFELEYEQVANGYRSVSAFAPGVMGVTGMETSDIIHGVVKETDPDFLIVIDALASRSLSRVNGAIQLTNTGIHPGSGVNNKREEISKEAYGIPVFSIGVPTVVDAVTITSDTIDYLLKHFQKHWEEKDRPSNILDVASNPFKRSNLEDAALPDESKRRSVLGMVGTLSMEEKTSLLKEVLTPLGHNFIVSPKEADGFIRDMSLVLASSLNEALHPAVASGEGEAYR
ncbi:GPR endopeptidase [Salimicrobium halophilum]|uniref:Germination protease n=1 Tax=Salimicrobium halophilum TaxID=86666 RepID=A0A1G8PP90_9BACI|nr:GPR endopeptidase [Salimicrobium halophilum]SDI94297.1 GPR endopeptidase Aspartic peptidase. MEROPS family A25 [Salimicrobium halophilum]